MCNPIAIDKAIINTLPIESFQGEIHVVDTVEDVLIGVIALLNKLRQVMLKLLPHKRNVKIRLG